MSELMLKITNPVDGSALPPVQWNFDELKEALTNQLARYDGLVYTEDTVTTARRDRSTLNKVRDAIENERKRIKKIYLAPYEKFEAQAKELTGMVNERSAAIDSQVKAYEETRKEQKQEAIRLAYLEYIGDLADLVPLARLQSPKWLNVSVSLKSIETELQESISRIRAALASINGLHSEFEQQIKDVYLRTLDLAEAIKEKDRLEKQKEKLAAYEAQRAAEEAERAAKAAQAQDFPRQPIRQAHADYADRSVNPAPVQPKHEERLYTVDFRVQASKEQLNALRAFMQANKINYGPVPNGGK